MNAAPGRAGGAPRYRNAKGAILVLALVCGCAVGPDYRAPDVPVPARYSAAGAGGRPGAELAEWWRVFDDAALTRLVEKAIAGSLDLRIAAARVREARALRRIARSALWPTVDGSASYRRIRQSENGPQAGAIAHGLAPRTTDLYDAALDASWEIDVFGGTRRAVEAAEAESGAAEEDRRDVLVSLLGELGSSYMELRGLKTELRVTEANIEAQAQTLALTRDRVQAGLATELDVARARAQVATTRAAIPALTSAIGQSAHRLAVLAGDSPGGLESLRLAAGPVPALPSAVPAGLPSELLRRRPDIRRAERELHAATARIGVAVADLYPHFFLTGVVGLESVSASDFVTGGSRFFSLGPAIHWPIFNAGRIRSQIEVQEIRHEQSFLAYRQTVLLTLEEVENALIAYREAGLRLQELREAEEAEERAVALAHDRYRSGLVDFLDVLDAEQKRYAAETERVRGERMLAQDLVRLYKALGGGWGHAADRAEASTWPISIEESMR